MKRAGRWAAIAWLVLAAAGCDRNLEAFDPDEEPHRPDLSKIFPEGAERAEPAAPLLPPAPGEARGAPPLAAERAEAPGDAAPPVTGRVELGPEVAAVPPAGAVLFIIARRAAGGPPLAVKRVPQPSFPLEFRLGPEDRMIQQMPFEGPFSLSARLDGDGNATSRDAGDLQGEAPAPHQPGDTGIVITLDEQL